MNARLTAATALRLLAQLRRDPRTVVLLLAVPSLLLVLLAAMLGEQPAAFDRIAPALLAVFPLITMFLVTSIATLRERLSGTLERLLTMPVAKADLVAGYALAFTVVTLVQVAVASAVALGPLGLDVRAGAGPVVVMAVLAALLGMALGLCLSAFASSEFQAVQFLPAVLLPQLLLCGLFLPRTQLPDALRVVADVLPVSFAVDGMGLLSSSTGWSGALLSDMAAVAAYAVAALVLAATSLRRRTA